jgi:hypothetical protein
MPAKQRKAMKIEHQLPVVARLNKLATRLFEIYNWT